MAYPILVTLKAKLSCIIVSGSGCQHYSFSERGNEGKKESNTYLLKKVNSGSAVNDPYSATCEETRVLQSKSGSKHRVGPLSGCAQLCMISRALHELCGKASRRTLTGSRFLRNMGSLRDIIREDASDYETKVHPSLL